MTDNSAESVQGITSELTEQSCFESNKRKNDRLTLNCAPGFDNRPSGSEQDSSALPFHQSASTSGGSMKYLSANALLCAFLTVLAVLATHPVLEMGTNDDWSYARTALDLARTGHIVYNGWATAMLGWQLYWGAVVIKLFGFSFLALRFSTLPFAMGAAYLLHQISVRLGLNARNAILATLTIVLSPLFLPLATSFMTDVPAFFWLLVGLYACLRAIDSGSSRSCMLWLAFASAADVTAGTARQIVWLGALVMVPCAAWIERRRPGVVAAALALWAGSFIATIACLYWFSHQPYSIPERIIAGAFTPALLPHAAQQIRDLILSLLLLTLPVFAAMLVELPRVSKRVLFPLLGIMAVLFALRIYTHGVQAFGPWTPNIVTEYGVGGSGSWENLGRKPVVLSPWVRGAATCMVFLAACVWLAKVMPRMGSRRPSYSEQQPHIPSRTLGLLLGPFILAYFAMLLPRAIFGLALDRYLIPLLAVLVIVMLRYFQNAVRRETPAFCFVLLAIFSAYGIAATHDYFATARARLAAASLIHAAGVPRTEIQGGWEYDGWTQLSAGGYINDPRLQVPAGAYKRINRVHDLPESCQFDFAKVTPAIDPRFFVVFSPQSCLASSSFPPVAYHTWLPPFEREIYIQQLPSRD